MLWAKGSNGGAISQGAGNEPAGQEPRYILTDAQEPSRSSVRDFPVLAQEKGCISSGDIRWPRLPKGSHPLGKFALPHWCQKDPLNNWPPIPACSSPRSLAHMTSPFTRSALVYVVSQHHPRIPSPVPQNCPASPKHFSSPSSYLIPTCQTVRLLSSRSTCPL